MNAAVRAVTRSALALGWKVSGVMDGYAGLLRRRFIPLGARDVGGIIHHGGTMLGTARSSEFRTDRGQHAAVEALHEHALEALVVIGGNGSLAGAYALHELGVPVVGIAATIDNDVSGSDIAIGVDTALNVALEAIDRLRVTASSHHRAFIVEVMGRECGYLALMVGIAGGAEAVVIPEMEQDPENLAAGLRAACERGKSHALVVVAEGARNNAASLVRFLNRHQGRFGFEPRATILGHVQRGGVPTAFDRLLATRLGAEATSRLAAGEAGVMVGLVGTALRAIPLSEVLSSDRPLDASLLRLARVLAA